MSQTRRDPEADAPSLALRLAERVKELTLLHHIALLFQQERPWDRSVLEEVVASLPAAWQHASVCQARVACDGFEVETPGFRETPWLQSRSFELKSGQTGRIDIAYVEERPRASEGPFLAEERALIDSVAEMLRVHVERKHAELSLLRAEAKLSSFFLRAPVGILITQVADGRIVEINELLEKLLGRSRAELIGHTTVEAGVWPDEASREEAMASARRAGGTLDFELFLPTKSGQRAPLNASAQIFELEGESLVLTVVTDLTRQRAAESAIQASTARLRRVIASPIMGFAFGSEDGTLAEANDEYLRIVGYDRDDLATGRMNLWRLMSPEQSMHHHTALGELAASGATKLWETELVRKDETRVPVMLGVATIDDSSDDWVAFVFDRTMQQSLENQLRQAQKLEAVGQLAAGIAHDFNNMLSSISMSAELLQSELERGDTKLDYTREILSASQRAAALTRQLLAFSRQQVLEPRVLGLNDLIHDFEPMLHRVLRDDVTIELRLDPELGRVRADPSQLLQVLLNLAVNARDAMAGAGRLIIETADEEHSAPLDLGTQTLPPGRYVMLAVEDTGLGMDERTKQRLFEPFFTTKAPGKGTGLGLSTVLGIVQQSGGAIDVTSERGRGARFRILLPLVDQPLDPLGLDGPAEIVGGRETILLVEDDASLRRMTRRALARLGYRVLEASGPAEARKTTRTYGGTIHLLLSDVVMEEQSGRVLAEALVAERPELRVVLMSGYSPDEVVRRGSLPSGFAFIQKPFSTEKLAARLRAALDAP